MPTKEPPTNQRACNASCASAEAAKRSSEFRSTSELSAMAAQRLSLLAEMTAGIAHDFRNILAVIDSGLRLAERSPDDSIRALAFIAGAREGVARGLALTSRLPTFSKQREFEARAADVNELLKGLKLFLEYGAGSEIRIVFELSNDISECLLDPGHFNEAVLNLVVNARDAMPNGGEIRISTARWEAKSSASDIVPGQYIRVRIQDGGMGMTKQVLQNIFQPFFTTKGDRGTGLGIPQVHAFMHQVGGHIRVASELGFGTTFDLFFRVVISNEAPACHNMLLGDNALISDCSRDLHVGL